MKKFPGFSAESSLYTSFTSYCTQGNDSHDGRMAVVPSKMDFNPIWQVWHAGETWSGGGADEGFGGGGGGSFCMYSCVGRWRYYCCSGPGWMWCVPAGSCSGGGSFGGETPY